MRSHKDALLAYLYSQVEFNDNHKDALLAYLYSQVEFNDALLAYLIIKTPSWHTYIAK